MKKKSYRIFFVSVMLLLFFFGNFGSFILFHFSEEQNREHRIRRLKSEDFKDLTRLMVSFAELHNKNIFLEQEEGEIIYKGHLYDVAKKVTQPGGILFYCLNDSREEALNAEINEQVKTLFDQMPSGKTSSKILSVKMLQDYLTMTPVDLNPLTNCICFLFTRQITPTYGAVHPDIFIPPPSPA